MKKFSLFSIVFFVVMYGVLMVETKGTVHAQNYDYKSTITVKITKETVKSKATGSKNNNVSTRTGGSAAGGKLPQTGQKISLYLIPLGFLLLVLVGAIFLWTKKSSENNKKESLNL